MPKEHPCNVSPVIVRKECIGQCKELLLLGVHVMPAGLGEVVHGPLQLFLAPWCSDKLIPQAPANFSKSQGFSPMLGLKDVQNLPRLGCTLAQALEQARVFLRVVKPERERLDVVKHAGP